MKETDLTDLIHGASVSEAIAHLKEYPPDAVLFLDDDGDPNGYRRGNPILIVKEEAKPRG